MSFGTKPFYQSNMNSTPAAVQDIEVPEPPTDCVSSLRFSPASINQTLLMASSWDCTVKLWEISGNGQVMGRLQQVIQSPILSSCWHTDGTKAFICGTDKAAHMWDIASNTMVQIAAHDAPIKTIHYIQSPSYSVVMTGGWDKKLRFWDLRSPNPAQTLDLSDKVYCADMHYPMAVVGLANRSMIIYNLENGPVEYKRLESQLKYQSRCVSIFLDKSNGTPSGYALGSIEGRVGIQCLTTTNSKDTFTFKCHRSAVGTTPNTLTQQQPQQQQQTQQQQQQQDIYAVNDIAFHPTYQTLATVGSDGKYTFWDKDARTKLKGSADAPVVAPGGANNPGVPTGDAAAAASQQPITCCAIDPKGQIFAYAHGYDWSKGHEYNNPVAKKPKILLRNCNDEMRPQKK